ncbi:MAG: bifunctional pyr operon transcriptional regulator/uracil phosphoribosyltransferase PyrR [Porcipelethomonas sp.]
MERKTVIMDENAMNRAVARITYEILERNKGAENICLVGIISRGVALAERIAAKISELENVTVPCGALDITPFRDDMKPVGLCDRTQIDFGIKDRKVVIVDDVIYTGRSTRAAIDALIERGRPEAIQLAVLIDRGHREIPIRPDYVGKNLPTSREEKVNVFVKEIDGNDGVTIFSGQRGEQ